MPRLQLNRRGFLGIALAGSAGLLWKPNSALALGGALPDLGVEAPDFN